MRALFALTGLVFLAAVVQAETIQDRSPDSFSGCIAAARAAVDAGDYQEAESRYRECENAAPTFAGRVLAITGHAITVRYEGHAAESRRMLESAFSMASEHSDETDMPAVRDLLVVQLSLSCHIVGDYNCAELVLRSELARENALHRSSAVMLRLVDLLREEGRLDESFALVSEAEQMAGLSRAEKINILVEKAQIARGMHHWNESVALWNQVRGMEDGDPLLDAAVCSGLGGTWLDAGNNARAEPLLRRAVAGLKEDPDASAEALGMTLAALARLLMSENKPAMAEDLLTEAVTRVGAIVGDRHPEVGVLLGYRSRARSLQGDHKGALADIENAEAIMSDHFGADSIALGAIFLERAEVERSAQHPDLAVSAYSRAMQTFRRAGNTAAALRASMIAPYAAALKAAHRSDEAKALVKSWQEGK